MLPRFDRLELLQDPKQGEQHLGEGELLTDTDARATVERDVLPSAAAPNKHLKSHRSRHHNAAGVVRAGGKKDKVARGPMRKTNALTWFGDLLPTSQGEIPRRRARRRPCSGA